LEVEQDLIGGGDAALHDVWFDAHPPIHLGEALLDVGQAANDGRLPRYHGSSAHPLRGYQGRRQITRADIFGQGAGNLLGKVTRNRY
jgi:hypothetical protein